jgi:uncharacterized protein YegL
MTHRRIAPVLAALLFLVSAVAGAAAGEPDALSTYRKRFTKDAYTSVKEEVLKDLAAAGGRPARDAIGWCVQQARLFLDQVQRDAERVYVRFKSAQDAYMEQFEDYARQFEKQGKPRPNSHPANWPTRIKFDEADADMKSADRAVADAQAILESGRAAYGRVIDTFPEADAAALRTEITAGPLASKDWAVRADAYDLLAFAKAPWVLRVLQDAAQKEEDPRALVAALSSLGGRDPVHVIPTLKHRLDDARWSVRAAALAALERTPCREAVDAIIARFPKEEGRLRDDCVRALVALTGGDVARTPEAWAQYWAMRRETWTGPPPKVDPDKPPPNPNAPFAGGVPASEGKKTGFFGIDLKSRRLVFVIDLSGSMNEKASDKSKETRADVAKAELVRAVRALEDGSLFSIVLYSNDVRVWKPEMVTANADTRKAAVEFIEKAAVVGGTATFDALAAALVLGDVGKGKARAPDGTGDAKLDTVLLLSDGKPTAGRYVDPDQIRAAVKDLNKLRGIAIHSIAFGKDADDKFMEGRAKDAGGTFLKM